MSSKPPFRERFLLWRNSWLMSPRFQRAAMRLPIFRRISQTHAASMFGVITGFVYTKTLTATVDLGIIARLAESPASTADLALIGGLPEAAMARLMSAAAAIDLVESLGSHAADAPYAERWTLGQRGAALSSNKGALAMIEHHKLFYDDLADPISMLRQGRGGGKLAAFWSYAEAAGRNEPASPADPRTHAYSALMAASQPMVAEQVLDSHDFSRHKKLLDIGGGHGAFLAEVAARHPSLALGLFDLPPVAAAARSALDARGLPNVAAHGGSFRDDALPEGADLVTLVRILHDHDDSVVTALLAKVHAALPPDGTLLVAEPMAGTAGAEAMGDAYFGLYLWAMGSGRPRTAVAYRNLLEAAGFRRIREKPTPLPMVTRLLEARK